MKIASIASGSNGNCYYLGNDDEAILVDAGISAKQIVERMTRLGLSLSMLRGIFVSHEHSDHIRGIEVFCRKHAVPVFMTEKTYESSRCIVSSGLIKYFSPGQQINIGNICVTPFLKSHDAVEPCSFSVSSGNKNVAVMTDIGFDCENVKAHIRNADAVFLESNYDDHMLRTGYYPAYLKKRIASDIGHLSNTQAAGLAVEHASVRLRHIFLSHLSANNNTPQLALGTFRHFIKQRTDLNLNVVLTSREKESSLVCLD